MKTYTLNDSLGLDDARRCNKDLGCALDLDPKSLAKGQSVTLTDAAVEYLTEKRGLRLLLSAESRVKGQAKQPEITAPAK